MSGQPIITQDFRLMQGDEFTRTFIVYQAAPYGPQSLLGYAADFSLRQNYGDQNPIFTMSITGAGVQTNSPNGSAISLGTPPASTVLAMVVPRVLAADTMALPTMVGQRLTKFYYQCRVTPPGAGPLTLAAGTWYVWTRV